MYPVLILHVFFTKLDKHSLPIDGCELQAQTEGKGAQRSTPVERARLHGCKWRITRPPQSLLENRRKQGGMYYVPPFARHTYIINLIRSIRVVRHSTL